MASYTITPELAASLQRLVKAGLLRVQNTVPPFPVQFGPAPRPSSVVLEEINEEAPPAWTQMSRGPLLLTASAGSSPLPETEAPPARDSIPIELDDRSSTDETPLVVRTRKSQRAAAAKAKEALLSEETYSSEEVPEEVVESKRSAKSAPKKRTREVSSSTATPAKKQKTPARRVTRQSARKGTEAADTELDVKDMSTRGLVKEVVVDVEYLRTHDLQEVLDLFEVQKWVDAFAATEVNEDLVREFYSTLSVEQAGNMMAGSYHRGGEVYVFTSRELAKELGVPHTGYSSYTWKYCLRV